MNERELRQRVHELELQRDNARACARHYYDECLTQGEEESDKEWLRRNPWLREEDDGQ